MYASPEQELYYRTQLDEVLAEETKIYRWKRRYTAWFMGAIILWLILSVGFSEFWPSWGSSAFYVIAIAFYLLSTLSQDKILRLRDTRHNIEVELVRIELQP